MQVQAQFDVYADTIEDAADIAVSAAMDIEPSEWGTVELAIDEEARSDDGEDNQPAQSAAAGE
jgi:hypothetical protein